MSRAPFSWSAKAPRVGGNGGNVDHDVEHLRGELGGGYFNCDIKVASRTKPPERASYRKAARGSKRRDHDLSLARVKFGSFFLANRRAVDPLGRRPSIRTICVFRPETGIGPPMQQKRYTDPSGLSGCSHGSNQTKFAPIAVRRTNHRRAGTSLSRGDLPQHYLANAPRQYDKLGGGHAWHRSLGDVFEVGSLACRSCLQASFASSS
jgi:hypothetical protein